MENQKLLNHKFLMKDIQKHKIKFSFKLIKVEKFQLKQDLLLKIVKIKNLTNLVFQNFMTKKLLKFLNKIWKNTKIIFNKINYQ